MKPKTASVDEFIAMFGAAHRALLTQLRREIRAAAPKAEECISYHMPAYRQDGRVLVYFGAAAKHCALYPGAYPIEKHRAEVEGYSTSKGTIRFPIGDPLPGTLVRKLVKARIAEHAASVKAKPRPKRRG